MFKVLQYCVGIRIKKMVYIANKWNSSKVITSNNVLLSRCYDIHDNRK